MDVARRGVHATGNLWGPSQLFFFLQVLFVWGTDGDVDLLRQCTYACRLAYRCQSNEKVLMIWKYLKTQSFCICGGWQNLSALTDDTTAGSIIVFDIHGDWLVMSSSRLKFFGPWPYRGILFPSILFLFLPKTNMKSRGWKILGRFRDRCYLFFKECKWTCKQAKLGIMSWLETISGVRAWTERAKRLAPGNVLFHFLSIFSHGTSSVRRQEQEKNESIYEKHSRVSWIKVAFLQPSHCQLWLIHTSKRRLPRMTFVHYMDPEQASFSDLYKSKRASRGLRGYRGYSVPLEADWKGGGEVHGKVKTWAYFLRFLESMGVCDCVYKGTSMHASKLYLDRIFRIILFSSDRGLACSEVINLKWIQEPLLLHRFRRNTCYGRTCELHIWAIKHFAQTPARAWYLQSREESICNRTWKKNWWTMWVENPAKRKRQIERVPCQQQ